MTIARLSQTLCNSTPSKLLKAEAKSRAHELHRRLHFNWKCFWHTSLQILVQNGVCFTTYIFAGTQLR